MMNTDLMLRSKDHVNPTISGTISSFLDSIKDPSKIQCILDISLAQVTLPEPLRCDIYNSIILNT